jgi:NADP-dependent 3-hydroxy acid dehydrogenase YdfG
MARKTSGPKLKRVRDQVIVITGASSGIGLATARMAAARGARVVLSSRNEDDLRAAVGAIRAKGGRATYCVADVGDETAVDRIGEIALREFGGLDTWVNNAGVSLSGRLTDIPMVDKKRLFDTNFWGVVNGCRTAVRLLKHRGGAVINLGGEVSDRAIPTQGIYSASKHAVAGFTDALRMELEHDRLPISVTLVKPSAIDSPSVEHARNDMEEGVPALPPPVQAREVVADAILQCAERPIRDITVGGARRGQVLLAALAPRLTDLYMERTMFEQQRTHDRAQPHAGSLDRPQRGGRTHGPQRGRVLRSSAYARAALSDVTRALPFVAAGVALAAGVRWRRGAA